MQTCSVEGCGRPHDARGFCSAHYGRWKRYGDPEGGPHALRSADEATRFWTRARRSERGEEECWPWPGAKRYGTWKRPDGRYESTQRTAWRLTNGREPGEVVRHLCHVPACVNPTHLADGTQSQNVLDEVERGTHDPKRGERNGAAKYSADQAREVGRLRGQGLSYAAIEAATGVNRWTVRNIVRRGYWKEALDA